MDTAATEIINHTGPAGPLLFFVGLAIGLIAVVLIALLSLAWLCAIMTSFYQWLRRKPVRSKLFQLAVGILEKKERLTVGEDFLTAGRLSIPHLKKPTEILVCNKNGGWFNVISLLHRLNEFEPFMEKVLVIHEEAMTVSDFRRIDEVVDSLSEVDG